MRRRGLAPGALVQAADDRGSEAVNHSRIVISEPSYDAQRCLLATEGWSRAWRSCSWLVGVLSRALSTGLFVGTLVNCDLPRSYEMLRTWLCFASFWIGHLWRLSFLD